MQTLQLVFDNAKCEFEFKKIDRSKAYGTKTRVATGLDGEECIRAELFESVVIRSGMTSRAKKIAKRKNKIIDKKPSTLGEVQEMEICELEEMLNYDITSMLELSQISISKKIVSMLDGQCFKFEFSYRKSYSTLTGFLIKSRNKYYALIGERVESEWVDHDFDVDIIEADFDFESL